MAVKFSVPPSPKLYTEKLRNFRGVDFANNATQVDTSRSPNAQNIISNLAGKPSKRTGYETLITFEGEINGIYRLATSDTERFLVHAGTKLHEWDMKNNTSKVLYEDMNDARSAVFQNNKRLYILDGKTYLCYGEFDGAFAVKKVKDIATVPVCVLSRNPDGSGGTARHDVNVLTSRRTYSFYGTEEATEYHLSTDDVKIDDGEVTAKVLSAEGEWETAEIKSVDRAKGIITFNSAPGKSPINGTDNVEITFSAESEYDAGLVDKCTIATQFGYNGATDRVFLAGNPDAVNFHYWSEINDPCYFPGLNYAYLGQDSSAIVGYSHIGNALAVHKEDNEQDQTIFLVTGSYDEQNGYQFAISGSVAGVGAISKHCFARLGTEPMFLSREGVFALTTQYLTAEKYAQNRSWYVNEKLTKEPHLADATAIVYNGYYYLAVGDGKVYVADSRQKAYEKNAPQSEFQYEWYYLTNIDARVWWEYDGRLYFGDTDGKVKRFKLEADDTVNTPTFSDDGQPIHAFWYTPIFTFDTLYYYKTLKNLHVMTAPEYRRSSITIGYRIKGGLISVKSSTMDIFDFNDIDFNRFTFNTDDSPMVIVTNTKAKKFMHIQFLFENNAVNEGFGFYEAEANYTITGKYKG